MFLSTFIYLSDIMQVVANSSKHFKYLVYQTKFTVKTVKSTIILINYFLNF